MCFQIRDYIAYSSMQLSCPVGWGCRIHRLLLCRGGKTPLHNQCPGYDTKQFDGEVPVMLELWGMQSTPSLPSLPGPLRPRVLAPDRVLSIGQIELNCVLMLNWIVWNRTVFDIGTVLMLNWIVWNWTVLTFNCLSTKKLYLYSTELFEI